MKTEDDAQKAANILHGYGIATVLITLGAKGVWLSETGQGRTDPGSVQALYTTAAGDTGCAFVTASWKVYPVVTLFVLRTPPRRFQ